jgi:hypothetical protein
VRPGDRSCSLLSPAGRGLPGSNSLFFASPKKSKQKKGDPTCCVPALRYGQPAVLGSGGVSLNSLRSNTAIPDPPEPALLGASRRGGEKETEYPKKQGHAVACPCGVLYWFWYSVPAPHCPVLAGPRSAEASGSGIARCLSEASLRETPLDSSTAGCPKRSVGTQTAGRLFFGDFLLAKQKKVTCRRATPGQQNSAKSNRRSRAGFDKPARTGRSRRMNLSEPFVRRPVATVLLTIGLALAGIGAFFVLPVSPCRKSTSR